MRTYLVGRSAYADIVIADPSVAEQHAELVVAADGRIFVTDCGAGDGTWRLRAGGDWEPIRQRFVEPADVLRLGDHRCAVAALLEHAAPQDGGEAGPYQDAVRVPKGRVERDPTTGEIVRRRL
jgi:hypothetical protein